jgi:hypothetical protein
MQSLDIFVWFEPPSVQVYSVEEKVWKVREAFRPFFLQGRVTYAVVWIKNQPFYFSAEHLAHLGNWFGLNLLDYSLGEVPELLHPLKEEWLLESSQKECPRLYARASLEDPLRLYDVNIFQQYPPMGTGPAWRLERFSCKASHRFLFYHIYQKKRVCPRCLLPALSPSL